MPRIYVAYRTDEPGTRLASGSLTTIKARIREVLSSEWEIAEYRLAAGVPTMCAVIEDLSSIEAEEAEGYRVTASGQVRKA